MLVNMYVSYEGFQDYRDGKTAFGVCKRGTQLPRYQHADRMIHVSVPIEDIVDATVVSLSGKLSGEFQYMRYEIRKGGSCDA